MSQLLSDTQDNSAQDKRPDPKPRKHPQLWQSYLWWRELMEMRKRHLLRISSAEKGKCNYDIGLEREIIDRMNLDILVNPKNKEEQALSVETQMIEYGKLVGPIWDWCLSHKGIGPRLAAQLLAQIDDVNNSPTVSALWRFAGFAVIDGKAEKNKKGETGHYNRILKGVCYNIADQFIRHQTPHYVDIYYAEKERQRALHPEPIKNGNGTKIYTDGHLHYRAWRKMIKEFLKDLWLAWREYESETQ